MADRVVGIERAGPVAVLRMAGPAGSAMDVDFLRALRAAFAEIAATDAGAVVVTGSGAVFSSGVHLTRLLEGGSEYARRFLPELSGCFLDVFAYSRPVVAAVNGHAIAGGCILALACDHRVLARGAGRMGVPELRVGVPFPLAPLEIVRFALPPHVAHEAALTGMTYGAEEALARGLADELVEPARLLERAVAVAAELAAPPAASFARVKQDLHRPVLETVARLGAEHDRGTLAAWESEPVRRAIGAYVEKTLGRTRR